MKVIMYIINKHPVLYFKLLRMPDYSFYFLSIGVQECICGGEVFNNYELY